MEGSTLLDKNDVTEAMVEAIMSRKHLDDSADEEQSQRWFEAGAMAVAHLLIDRLGER